MQRCATLVVIALLNLGGASAADQRPISSRIVRQPVHSHVLAAVGYSKRLHALEVEFISGAIYRYSNVPTAGVPRFSQRCFQGPILRCECARAFSVGPCQTATNLMFVLTKEEKRVICFVMLAILVGLGVKEYRRGHTANSSGGQHGLKQSLGKQAASEAASERYCGASSEYP